MLQLEIAIMLPYFLLLENGSYSTGLDGSSHQLNLRDVDNSSDGAFPKRTQVSSIFRSDAVSDNDIQRRKIREVEELLRQTNRLLRWYRVETRRAAVTELTRIQASPFYFRSKEKDVLELWLEEVTFEPSLLPLDNRTNVQNVTKAVKKGLAGRNDPEVSRLFLLDAEQALKDGRFREAVLFCWSTIDATFNTKYEAVVDQALAGEWAEGRNWLKDNRFGMKNKMSAILYLMTGYSLAREENGFWSDLGQSYKKRNSIIHKGETAQEADAELALSVANRMVALMASLKPKRSKQQKRD